VTAAALQDGVKLETQNQAEVVVAGEEDADEILKQFNIYPRSEGKKGKE